ncbi:MAG: SCO family protein [Leeuwenhoekiella sp.]
MNAKKTYIGIAAVVLLFGILFIPKIIKRIANDEVVKNDRLNVARIDAAKDTSNDDLSYITIDGKDRRVPAFEFINQEGDTISDKDYRGKVFVVDFFFTRCPSICIPMTSNLVLVQEEFEDRKDFGIASISIDPEGDTPEVLKAYAESYGADHPHWNFLTGDRETIYSLANEEFNLLASENPNIEGGFLHSGYFALVDQNGFIRSRKDQFGNPKVYYRGSVPAGSSDKNGEDAEIAMLVSDIKKLLKTQ